MENCCLQVLKSSQYSYMVTPPTIRKYCHQAVTFPHWVSRLTRSRKTALAQYRVINRKFRSVDSIPKLSSNALTHPVSPPSQQILGMQNIYGQGRVGDTS